MKNNSAKDISCVQRKFDVTLICRQKEIFAEEDFSESDPREVEAAKHNLTYIGMDGNIGCLGKYEVDSGWFLFVPWPTKLI